MKKLQMAAAVIITCAILVLLEILISPSAEEKVKNIKSEHEDITEVEMFEIDITDENK